MKITIQSNELKQILSKYNNTKYISYTNKTKQLLSNLHNDMLKRYNYMNKYLSLNPTIEKIINISQIIKPNYFNKTSFPYIIINHIEKKTTTQIYYSFSLHNKPIKVYFVLEKNVSNTALYDKYIKNIIIWLCMLHDYSPKECVKTLTIYFYFTSLKKLLPNTKIEILNQNHVNTAFTNSCPDVGEIVIFRKEEWFKCFIHETFHTFGLDFSTMSNNNINKCLSSIFKVKSEINSYEAYTEFWAEIVNIFFCVFYNLENKKDINEFYSKCELYMNLERIFSFVQMVKVLDFMGLTYSDLFKNTSSSVIARENLYREHSSVLSYYIIKCVLFNDFQGFIQWCNCHNDKLFHFKKTIANQKLFCVYIDKHYKTKSMMDELQNVVYFLENLKNKKNTQIYNYMLTNLRMSLHELG
jgi:hypothetical protein